MKSKKIIGLSVIGAVTSPIWYPLSLLGYLAGYSMVKTAQFVVNNPKTTIGGIAITAGLMYGCNQINQYQVVETLTKNTTEITEKIKDNNRKERQINELEDRIIELESLPKEPYKEYAQQLESKLTKTEAALDFEKRKSDLLQHELIRNTAPETKIDYLTYFVDEEKSWREISVRLTGTPDYSNHLQNLNSNVDILPGRAIKIEEELCKRKVEGLFQEVPEIKAVILPKEVSTQEYFGNYSEEVLQLNNILGLDYATDENRDRVVWYQPSNL